MPDQSIYAQNQTQIMKKKLLVALKQLAMRLIVIQILLAFFVFASYATDARGQEVLNRKISISVRNTELKNVLEQVQILVDAKFVFSPSIINVKRKLSFTLQDNTVAEFLKKMVLPLGIGYKAVGNMIILYDARDKDEANKILVIDEIVQAERATADRDVSGAVVNEKNEPVAGASVLIRGTRIGTLTDAQGKFRLSVPGNQIVTLEISSVGYQTQIVEVNASTNAVTVNLSTNVGGMDEVVVIGYGTQRKGDITSSVVSLKSENFVKAPVKDIGQLMQGKFAGVIINNTSGDPTSNVGIQLRGRTTLFGASSSPLILIDGMPGDFNTISPEDIESIDVLKDGSAAAIYGIRANNGVVIITTKKHSNAKTNTVEYSAVFGTEKVARKLDLLTAQDVRSLLQDTSLHYTGKDNGYNTDWFKEATRSPKTQIHNLTFRGGSRNTNYIFNLNYRNIEGIFLKTFNNQFSGRADIQHRMFDDKLKFDFQLLGRQVKSQNGDGYVYHQVNIQNPTSPVKNTDGTWFEEHTIDYDNPISLIEEYDRSFKSQYTRFNANVVYEPMKNLSLTALFGYGKYNHQVGFSTTHEHRNNTEGSNGGFVSIDTRESIDRLFEFTTEYKKIFGKHNLRTWLGYSYQENEAWGAYADNNSFQTDVFGYANIGFGYGLQNSTAHMSSYRGDNNIIGFFGRVSYQFMDRYLLMASLRREAHSHLKGANKPWGWFPAVSAGWKLNEEEFIKSLNVFDNLKLRYGFGITGNAPNSPFLALTRLNYSGFVYVNGQWIRALSPASNPNPALRWEEKKEHNLGLDFSVMRDRLFGSFDLYDRTTDGLLYDFQVPVPPNLYPSTRANVGVLNTKGIEVSVSYRPVVKKDFEWTTQALYSSSTTKLVRLSNDLYKLTNDYFEAGYLAPPIYDATHIVKVGEKIGNIWGYKVTDIDENGRWIYQDSTGKSVPSAGFKKEFKNKHVLGNGLPKFYLGWNNTFRYRNLDLNLTMRGAFGYQIVNIQRLLYEPRNDETALNRLKSGYDKVFGKAVLSKNEPGSFNSYYVEDGDFWKIDNVVLGYNFNTSKIKYIKNARVYVSLLNALTFTDYSGIDPEVDWGGLTPSRDPSSKYPTTRQYSVGLNVTF